MKRSSLAWSFGHQATRQGLTLCVYFAMAHVLEPADFGTMAILLAWLAIPTLLVDSGFGAAVVQRMKLTEEHLTTAFASNVVIAFVSFIAIWSLAPAISRAYEEPLMVDLLRVLALAILLSSAVSTKVSLAQREMMFRQLAIRDSVAAFIGGFAGIGCALAGLGIWSLVIQMLMSTLVSTVVMWRVISWRPYSRYFSLKALRDLSGYSSRVLLYGLIKVITQYLDVIVIGYTMGVAMAGLYSFASKMVVTPMGAVRAAFGAYFFPAFSRIQHDRDILATEFERALKLVGYGITPFLLIFYFAVDQFVDYALPAKWIDTVPVAKALTFVALFQGFIAISGELMKAMGRPGILIWWAGGLSVSTAAAIFIGSHWGLIGIAASIAIVHAVGLIVNLSICVWITVPKKWARLFCAALGPVSIFLFVVVAGETLLIADLNGWFGSWARLLGIFILFSLVIIPFRAQVLGWLELVRTGR